MAAQMRPTEGFVPTKVCDCQAETFGLSRHANRMSTSRLPDSVWRGDCDKFPGIQRLLWFDPVRHG